MRICHEKTNSYYFLIFLSFNAYAVEILDVCATYLNSGKRYKVEGHLLNGSELNQRTNSYKYESWSTYLVIFWSNDQATIIKLDFHIGSGLSPFGEKGKDQRGYPWQVSEGHLYCW